MRKRWTKTVHSSELLVKQDCSLNTSSTFDQSSLQTLPQLKVNLTYRVSTASANSSQIEGYLRSRRKNRSLRQMPPEQTMLPSTQPNQSVDLIALLSPKLVEKRARQMRRSLLKKQRPIEHQQQKPNKVVALLNDYISKKDEATAQDKFISRILRRRVPLSLRYSLLKRDQRLSPIIIESVSP